MDWTTESSGIEKSSWKIVPSNAFSACFIPFALLIPLLNVGDDTSFSGTARCPQFSQVTLVPQGKEPQLVPSICLAVLFRCQVAGPLILRARLNSGPVQAAHRNWERRAHVCVYIYIYISLYICLSADLGGSGEAGSEEHGAGRGCARRGGKQRSAKRRPRTARGCAGRAGQGRPAGPGMAAAGQRWGGAKGEGGRAPGLAPGGPRAGTAGGKELAEERGLQKQRGEAGASAAGRRAAGEMGKAQACCGALFLTCSMAIGPVPAAWDCGSVRANASVWQAVLRSHDGNSHRPAAGHVPRLRTRLRSPLRLPVVFPALAQVEVKFKTVGFALLGASTTPPVLLTSFQPLGLRAPRVEMWEAERFPRLLLEIGNCLEREGKKEKIFRSGSSFKTKKTDHLG